MASAARYKKCDIGKIVEISGIDEAREVSGIKDIKIVHKAGDYSNVIKSSNDRVCYVISQEDSVEKAIESCEKALEKIKVKVQK